MAHRLFDFSHLSPAERIELASRAPEHYPVALDDIRKALLPRVPYVVYFVRMRFRPG